jgi:predicted amidohydrolase
MPDAPERSKRSRFLRLLLPSRRRLPWAVARLAILACFLILFRYHLGAWTVGAHNRAWRTWTGSERNHPADVQLLLRLREPGARMLVRIGEPSALRRARDPEQIPALLDLARAHPDSAVRVHALHGLHGFWDERTLSLAAELLRDDRPAVRRAAIETFERLGDRRHERLLDTARRSERNPELRAALERTLLRLPTAPGAPAAKERTVKVAAVQFISEMGRPEHNRERLERFIRQAAKNGARIVVLPETAITGYLSHDLGTTWQVDGRQPNADLSGRDPTPVAEPVSGPSTRAFGKLADELDIYLTIPFVEHDPADGRFYNTVVLAGPGGKTLLHYRKLHPWPYPEDSWATRGDRGLRVVDSPYGRLALLICYDINFEPPNLERLHADVLLYSIAWVDRPRSSWFHAELPRIARRHRFHIIGANWSVPRRPDWHGYGQSLIVDRSGRVRARASKNLGEEILYAELPLPVRDR